ncbi:hypothetical protein FI667_g16799, partial [Globisporangium splendens]
MESTKRKRPPDNPDFEVMMPRLACLRLRSRKRQRMTSVDEIVPESDSEPEQENLPAPPQVKLLKKMFSTYRAIYSKLVESSRDDCYKLKKPDRFAMYRLISQKHSLAKYLPEYNVDVPDDVMSSTFRDYEKALTSSMTLFKKLREKVKKSSFPELKFKSKKHIS